MHAAVFFALINVAVRSITFKINRVFLSGSMRNVVIRFTKGYERRIYIYMTYMTCPMASHGIPWQGTNCCTPSVLTSRMIIPTTVSTRNRMELEIAETSVSCRPQPLMDIDGSRNPLDLVRLVLGLRWCCSVKGQLGLLEMFGFPFSLRLLRCSSHRNGTSGADFQDIVKVAGRALRQNFVL